MIYYNSNFFMKSYFVSETLRKYPIIPFLNHVCVKNYKIPNSNFCIPKAMHIIIPVLSLQNDSNISPDPEDFRPERFDSDQVAKRNAYALNLSHFNKKVIQFF